MSRYRIHVKRDAFKFSSAHMTVFPDGRKERLHGHNFYLSLALELRDASFGAMVDFSALKTALRTLCDQWRERTLLARNNPLFELRRVDDEIEFALCGQRYVLPAGDVYLLPIDNVTVESLSAHAAELLHERLEKLLNQSSATALEVTVEESIGQGATTRLLLPATST